MRKLIPALFLYLLSNISFGNVLESTTRHGDTTIVGDNSISITRTDSLLLEGLTCESGADSLAGINRLLLQSVRANVRHLPALLEEKAYLVNDYRSDLENYENILDSAVRLTDAHARYELLNFIHQDISAKFWFPGMGAAPANPLTMVKVRLKVMNKNGDTELKGYIGYIKPQLSNLAKNVIVFIPTFENEKAVSPGVKMVWIEKDGKVVQSRVETLRRSIDIFDIAFLIND